MTLSDKGRECKCICHDENCHDSKCSCIMCYKNHLTTSPKVKQEAPTKQGWELEKKIETILRDLAYKAWYYGERENNVHLYIPKIMDLLRSKDQEADRRVSEAIKEIETKLKPVLEDFSKTGQKMIASGKLVRTGNEMIENVGYIKTILYQKLSSK